MDRRTVTGGCALVAAVAALVVAPSPAAAAPPVDRGNDRFSETFDGPGVELCGIPATLSVSGHSNFAIRPVTGSSEPFLARNAFQVTEVWTTAAGSLTIRQNGSFREQEATRVPGAITYDPDGDGPLGTVVSAELWRFRFKDSGLFRVYAASGRLLLKATGTFEAQELYDTLGDGVPGAVPIPGTFEVLRDQTGRSFPEAAFCEAVVGELT